MANPKPSHKFTSESARIAGAKGTQSRLETAVNLRDLDGLADVSMRRLVVTGREIERESRTLKGREKLEALKLQVVVDQTLLDRSRGKPRPTPEGQALPDDYAKAVREAQRRARELEQSDPQDVVVESQ